jgi:hypothetical protein
MIYLHHVYVTWVETSFIELTVIVYATVVEGNDVTTGGLNGSTTW